MWAPSSLLLLLVISTSQSFAFTASSSAAYSSGHGSLSMTKDTPENLPEFKDAKEYLEYMEQFSDLPKGFSTGTADGKFVSYEAPAMGDLPIRGTIIYLPEGPSDNWAACFTSNRVRNYY